MLMENTDDTFMKHGMTRPINYHRQCVDAHTNNSINTPVEGIKDSFSNLIFDNHFAFQLKCKQLKILMTSYFFTGMCNLCVNNI